MAINVNTMSPGSWAARHAWANAQPGGVMDEAGNVAQRVYDPTMEAAFQQFWGATPVDQLYAQFGGPDPASGAQTLATLRAAGATDAQLRDGLAAAINTQTNAGWGGASTAGIPRMIAQQAGINLDQQTDMALAARQAAQDSTMAAEQSAANDAWNNYSRPIGITLAMLGAAQGLGGLDFANPGINAGAAGADLPFSGITSTTVSGAAPTAVKGVSFETAGTPQLYGPEQMRLLEQAGQTPLYGPEQMDLLNRASGGAGYNVGPGYPSVPSVNMQFPSGGTPPTSGGSTTRNLATRALTSVAGNALSGSLKPTGADVDNGAFAGTLTDQAGRDELKSRIKGYFSGADRSQDLYDAHMAVYGEELGKRATAAERERRQQLARQSLLGGSVQADLSAKASEEESIGATRASEAARAAANRYRSELAAEEQNAYALADAGNPEAVRLASRSADLAYESALSKQNVDDLFGGLFQPVATGASLFNAANAQQAANLALLDRYRKAGQLYSSPSSRARVTATG